MVFCCCKSDRRRLDVEEEEYYDDEDVPLERVVNAAVAEASKEQASPLNKPPVNKPVDQPNVSERDDQADKDAVMWLRTLSMQRKGIEDGDEGLEVEYVDTAESSSPEKDSDPIVFDADSPEKYVRESAPVVPVPKPEPSPELKKPSQQIHRNRQLESSIVSTDQQKRLPQTKQRASESRPPPHPSFSNSSPEKRDRIKKEVKGGSEPNFDVLSDASSALQVAEKYLDRQQRQNKTAAHEELDETPDEPVAREQYEMACRILHRSLMERDASLTPAERDFLDDLLSSIPSSKRDMIERSRSPPPPEHQTKELVTDLARVGTALTMKACNGGETPTRSRKAMSPQSQRRDLDTTWRVRIDELKNRVPWNPCVAEVQGTRVVDGISDAVMMKRSQSEESEDFDDATAPFLVLGIVRNDESTKPRVLSPAIMEAFLGFLPAAAANENYWLKFSLVRDGGTLEAMLARAQGSQRTIMAIETTDGDVFGSFTSSRWQKHQGYFGLDEAFLWRLKRNRIKTPDSSPAHPSESKRRSWIKNITPSEMEVYPFTGMDQMVQHCSDSAIEVGCGMWNSKWDCPFEGEELGVGMMIDGSLTRGSSRSSATFANPCLCRGGESNEFVVRNLELWTLTPCRTEADAYQWEQSRLLIEKNLGQLAG